MKTVVQPATRNIKPHRSYRTLPMKRTGLISAILLTFFVELGIILALPFLIHSMTPLAAHVLNAAGFKTGLGYDTFLGIRTSPLTFSMPTHSFWELFWWIAACGIGIVVVSALRFMAAPLRYFINLNLLIIASEATYLYFMGHLGYDSNEFSVLMLRTAMLTWLVIPIFVAVLSILFPFNPLEQLLLLLLSIAYNVVITSVRYAVFIAVLSRTGPILMADLYLLYGPLLDIVPLIAIYSMFLVGVAKRLERSSEEWAWL